MLHILLMILKIIGIILLVLLGILLSLLLIVLFVPIRYHVKGSKEDTVIVGRARVSWLLGLIAFVVSYQEKNVIFQLKILGIDLLKLLKNRKEKKTLEKISVPKESNGDKVEKIADTKEKTETKDQEVQSEQKAQELSEEQNVQESSKKTVWEKIKGFPAKFAQSIRKIKLTITNICDKIKRWKNFLTDERVIAAIGIAKIHLIKVFKHILPKKLKGQVIYGFEDPCTTGQVLAGVSVLYPMYYKHFSISPDFSGQVLNGNIDLKGRIYVFYLVKSALAVFFDKNIQFIIHTFRNKEEL